jgi:hypothetical protein
MASTIGTPSSTKSSTGEPGESELPAAATSERAPASLSSQSAAYVSVLAVLTPKIAALSLSC